MIYASATMEFLLSLPQEDVSYLHFDALERLLDKITVMITMIYL